MLKVIEFFKSIQGESTRAGMVCSFVRLSGCNLSCTYCDTKYAMDGGTEFTVDEVLTMVEDFGSNLVEITGGEPLLQQDTPALCRRLMENGHTVLIETNGTQDISILPEGCIRIMDIKCPGSGSSIFFQTENLHHLRSYDECKFVISDKDDFDWALQFIRTHHVYQKCTVIFSPNLKTLSAGDLAEWILDSSMPIRLGLQLHKMIWGMDVKNR